ncbi:MAG: hypothetical protein ABEJ95_05520 [Candidatus Nanohalobium sp.]
MAEGLKDSINEGIKDYNESLAETNINPPEFLRQGLGAIWVITGALQIMDPSPWVNYVSPLISGMMPVSTEAFLLFHGAILVLEGLLLLADYGSSIVAGIITVGSALLLANLVIAGFMVSEILYTFSILLIAAIVSVTSAREAINY